MTFYKKQIEEINPQSQLTHPIFPDLVNNFINFHSVTKTEKHKVWPNIPPKYNNYKSILELKDDIIKNPDSYIENGPITVKCPVSLFYTCDSKLSGQPGGYDRLGEDATEIKNKSRILMKDQNGFSPCSDVLHGMVRWIYISGHLVGFAINKDRGNLRSFIALESNGGKDVEVLITLDFHENNPKATLEDIQQIEAEIFSADAIDRRGFSSPVRYRGIAIAKRKSALALTTFLDEILDVDYANIIKDRREGENKEKPKYKLSSLQSLEFDKTGAPCGYINKFKQENTVNAVQTLKNILNVRGGLQLSMSAIHCFIKSFYFVTETAAHIGCKDIPQNCSSAITTKEYLAELLLWHYIQKSMEGDYILDLSNLNKKGDTKDTTLLAFWEYMPVILRDIRRKNGRINAYGTEHPCIKAYLNTITDPRNRSAAISAITKN